MTEQILSNGSDTAKNSDKPKKQRSKGRPFEKNRDGHKDPRINRYGRPKGYDEARKAAIKMLSEVMGVTEVSDPITKEKRTIAVTRFEALLLDWITSRNFQKQKGILDLAGMLPKGDLPVQLQLDVRTMSNDQLERLARGESIFDVLKRP